MGGLFQQAHERTHQQQAAGGRRHHRHQAAQDPTAQFLQVIHQAHLHLGGELVLGRRVRQVQPSGVRQGGAVGAINRSDGLALAAANGAPDPDRSGRGHRLAGGGLGRGVAHGFGAGPRLGSPPALGGAAV